MVFNTLSKRFFGIYMSGTEFNKQYKNIKFIKFINEDRCHYGFKYPANQSIFKDTYKFNIKDCSKGGLYFIDEAHFNDYIDYGKIIREVKVPNSDQVHISVEHDKYKASEIELGEEKSIGEYLNDLSDKTLASVPYRFNHTNLKYIKNPSEALQKFMVRLNVYAISYIKDPSEEIQELAVNSDYRSIVYIKNPTKKVKKIALTKEPSSIRFIQNPSEELQEIAVAADPYVIRYIENPSVKVQNIAFSKDPYTIAFVKNK